MQQFDTERFQRLSRLTIRLSIVVPAHPIREDEVLIQDRTNAVHNIPDKAQPSGYVPTVTIRSLVGKKRGQHVKKEPMRAMELDAVTAGIPASDGRTHKFSVDLSKFFRRKIIDRIAVLVPGAGVSQLHKQLGAVRMTSLDNRTQMIDLLICPNTRSSCSWKPRRDRQRLCDHQTHAIGRPIEIMLHHRVTHEPIGKFGHTEGHHGSHDHAVLKLNILYFYQLENLHHPSFCPFAKWRAVSVVCIIMEMRSDVRIYFYPTSE